NQAEQLAKGLSQRTGLPIFNLLLRTKHTSKQSMKTRKDRVADLTGAFSLNPSSVKKLLELKSGLHLNMILIDDVYTTGSTMNQCASLLKVATGANIFGLTWAR